MANYVGLGVSLRPEMAHRLRLLAAIEGKTRSSLVRELLEGALQRRRQADVPMREIVECAQREVGP